MKVLKFGGTSVSSAESVLSVKKIVEAIDEPVIVVISALGGITDQLLITSQIASEGNPAYRNDLDEIMERHLTLIKEVVPEVAQTQAIMHTTTMLDELENIFRGVYLIKDLSHKTSDTIVSYGERLASYIISHVIKGAQMYDARQFIKTVKQFDKHIVDFELTNQLIKKTFDQLPKVALIPGFISSDKESGEITNLGRGGSDYTASILAAALNASILEIWTDVDGFMTADPKVISSTYLIEQLTFTEAMELCHFGAKVIYPPTIYPVCHKNIPIRIRNTFNPESPGTLISQENQNGENKSVIKGISSIDDTCLVTVQGLGMVGVIGVNYRIFKALASNGISVFMVCQASSENNTTFAVKNEEADLAIRVLNEEFALERTQGEINDAVVEKDLATVAIVGEFMRHTPGIAGKLFGTLGRAGISVIACAQGASEINISFVIKREYLRKALNSIHDSFFLSEYKVLNIFLVGTGSVGEQLLGQIQQQQPKLMKQNRLKLNVVGIANVDRMIFRREGLDLNNYREELETNGLMTSPKQLCDEILNMNIYNSVFVDCTASEEIATLYEVFLSNNISVVAANKIATSSLYANYKKLKDIARKRDIKFLFETTVGAGLPIINTMNSLINSGDRILKIEGVFSGTINYIFNTISEEIPLSKAIRMAVDAKYAEPDPRVDLSGKDVIRKLVVLAREAGYKPEQTDIQKNLFIPDSYFKGSITDFWTKIHQLDHEFEEKRKQSAQQHKHTRFVARMEDGLCEIGLMEVDSHHPFYELEGSNNIILITTERYHEFPMIIKGYGAGAEVTAAGVFADIISIANIR